MIFTSFVSIILLTPSYYQSSYETIFEKCLESFSKHDIFIVVINMIFKKLLVQYEVDHNLSHEQMAELCGVSRATYFRWLAGSTKLRTRTKENVAEVLGVSNINEVLEESENYKPILGTTRAGYDMYAEQDIQGYVKVTSEDSANGDYFLRVEGDSMEGSHIYDGDLIYVQQCECVPSGSIAVVLIGEEATVKKVVYKNDLMILEASNPKYESRYFTSKEVEELPVRILGRVRFVRTDF